MVARPRICSVLAGWKNLEKQQHGLLKLHRVHGMIAGRGAWRGLCQSRPGGGFKINSAVRGPRSSITMHA